MADQTTGHTAPPEIPPRNPATGQNKDEPNMDDETTATIAHWSSIPKYIRPKTPDFGDDKALIKQYVHKMMMLPSRGYDEVVPGIIIAEEASALDLEMIKREGVSHVLNTCQGDGFFWTDTTAEDYKGYSKFYGFHGIDANDYNITPEFERANKFLSECIEYVPRTCDDETTVVHSTRIREGQGKVLVHCKAGASRSATIVIAFLISIGWDMMYAVDEILKKREINMNANFVGRLILYERETRGNPK